MSASSSVARAQESKSDAEDAVAKGEQPPAKGHPAGQLSVLDVAAEVGKRLHDWTGLGLFRREKVVLTKTIGNATLREFTQCDCKGAILLAGFPSISMTSLLSAGYLIDQMKLDLLAVISSNEFPPRCVVQKGQPSHAIRLFGNKDIIVATSEFKIPTSSLSWDVTHLLLDFAERNAVRLLLSIEGLPMDDDDASADKKYEQKLAFVTTDAAFRESMQELGHDPLEDAVIVGITGAILAEGSMTQTPVAALIAPSASKYPDARSAVTVIKAIVAFMSKEDGNFEVDTGPLEEKATALAESVAKLVATEGTGDHANLYL